MKLALTVEEKGKTLRCGYTSGSCAAGAAQGAVRILLTGEIPENVCLLTPSGVSLTLAVRYPCCDGEQASCAVQKDAGDDPDVTDGMLFYARAQRIERGIVIEGGEGIGRVTRAGLACEVGSAAINPVPMAMITEQVNKVCALCGYQGGIRITLWVPGGEEVAKKTFNPRLGIEGGISILGTSGIVKPMSEQALLDTIALELRVLYTSGCRDVVLTPGNYGADFIERETAINKRHVVICSNFLGHSLALAKAQGFERILLIGHAGKLIKLAAGIGNTHSDFGDARMEILAAYAGAAGVGGETIKRILSCLTVDEALGVLLPTGKMEETMRRVMARIESYLTRVLSEDIPSGALMFSNRYGILGKTGRADELLLQQEELGK